MATLDMLYRNAEVVGNCMIWKGAKDKDGNPRVNFATYKQSYARQAAFSISGQDVIPNKVLHSLCQNPLCVLVEHLTYQIPRTHLLSQFMGWVNQDGDVPSHKPHLGKCHLWTGCLSHGRPALHKAKWGEAVAARWIYKLTQNLPDLPSSTTVNHHCDNPICVNTKHLFHKDGDETWNSTNMNDAIEKKRLHNQKFTPAEVKRLRERISKGERTKDLCIEFKCSKPTIADIKYNRSFYDPSYTPPSSQIPGAS
jgi:hypothetical protein